MENLSKIEPKQPLKIFYKNKLALILKNYVYSSIIYFLCSKLSKMIFTL